MNERLPSPGYGKKWRLLWWTLAGLLFAVAGWARFRLPLAPLSDPDIWAYLHPALSKLLGGPFQHTNGQCFLYPGLLYLVLKVGGDFRCITAAQHLLGLGTGALLLVAWRQVRGFLPEPRLPRFLFDLVGLGLAGVYLLFAPVSILFEHMLRPEAIFPFFAVLNIVCTLAFVRRRFSGEPRRTANDRLDGPLLALGTGAVLTSVAAWLLKPSFAAMLLLANLPMILALFLPGGTRRDKVALALVPVVAAGLLLILPEWRLRRDDPDARSFLAESLFTVHADLIRDQMADDLARHQTAPYDAPFLARVQAELAADILVSAKTRRYPSLGFDPDYLRHQSHFIRWLTTECSSQEKMAAFCEDWYRRAWQGRPAAMWRKIGRQLGGFYRFDACPAYAEVHGFDLANEYALTTKVFVPRKPPPEDQRWPRFLEANRYPPAKEYLAKCAQWSQAPNPVETPRIVEWAAAALSRTYLVLCLGAVSLGVAVLASPVVRQWSGRAAGVLLLLYSYNFGTTLMLSVGHSMDVARYSSYQLAYTLLPQGIALWLLLEGALTLYGKFLGNRAGPRQPAVDPTRAPADSGPLSKP